MSVPTKNQPAPLQDTPTSAPPPRDERFFTHLRRRRAAAQRLEPLPDGRRDPFEPVGRPPQSWTELDRCAAALLYLQRQGLRGLPSPEVAQALARYPERYADVLPQRPAA